MNNFSATWADSHASMHGSPNFLGRWFGYDVSDLIFAGKGQAQPNQPYASPEPGHMATTAAQEGVRCDLESVRRPQGSNGPSTIVTVSALQHAACSSKRVQPVKRKVHFACSETEVREFAPGTALEPHRTPGTVRVPTAVTQDQPALPRRPTEVAYIIAGRMDLRPDTIRGPLLSAPLTELAALLATPMEANGRGDYAICEPRRHAFTRAANRRWTPIDYLADAVSAVSYHVRSAYFVHRPLAHFPCPQLILTPVQLPHAITVIPLDLRPWGGQLYAATVRPGMTAAQVLALAEEQRSNVAADLQMQLRDGGIQMRDASGRSIAQIGERPEEHDWLAFAHEAGPADPADVTSLFQLRTLPALPDTGRSVPCRNLLQTTPWPISLTVLLLSRLPVRRSSRWVPF